MKEGQRINTAKTLHNSYFDGNNYDQSFNSNSPMSIDPRCEGWYDFALTEDPELLNDRKNTAELIHKIFNESEYSDGRFIDKGKDGTAQVLKIPKDFVEEVYKYVDEKLRETKKLDPIEQIIAINEFFDFDYKFVYNKVLTPTMKQEILEEFYKNGDMHERMLKSASIKLF